MRKAPGRLKPQNMLVELTGLVEIVYHDIDVVEPDISDGRMLLCGLGVVGKLMLLSDFCRWQNMLTNPVVVVPEAALAPVNMESVGVVLGMRGVLQELRAR
eukprot:2934562-Pyramimonas_sp.AAC.2